MMYLGQQNTHQNHHKVIITSSIEYITGQGLGWNVFTKSSQTNHYFINWWHKIFVIFSTESYNLRMILAWFFEKFLPIFWGFSPEPHFQWTNNSWSQLWVFYYYMPWSQWYWKSIRQFSSISLVQCDTLPQSITSK